MRLYGLQERSSGISEEALCWGKCWVMLSGHSVNVSSPREVGNQHPLLEAKSPNPYSNEQQQGNTSRCLRLGSGSSLERRSSYGIVTSTGMSDVLMSLFQPNVCK